MFFKKAKPARQEPRLDIEAAIARVNETLTMADELMSSPDVLAADAIVAQAQKEGKI